MYTYICTLFESLKSPTAVSSFNCICKGVVKHLVTTLKYSIHQSAAFLHNCPHHSSICYVPIKILYININIISISTWLEVERQYMKLFSPTKLSSLAHLRNDCKKAMLVFSVSKHCWTTFK